VTASLERRARAIAAAAAVRAWEYRQRRHAKGTWYRLRRLLTYSARALIISPDDAALLRSEGWQADPVGNELAPPKQLFVVSEQRAEGLQSGRPIPVRLGAELLAAANVALVPFASIEDGSDPTAGTKGRRR
jgi:hypothetical protein